MIVKLYSIDETEDYENAKLVSCYEEKHFDKLMKMLDYCKKKDIPFMFEKDYMVYVEDVLFKFPNNYDHIPVINVYATIC